MRHEKVKVPKTFARCRQGPDPALDPAFPQPWAKRLSSELRSSHTLQVQLPTHFRLRSRKITCRGPTRYCRARPTSIRSASGAWLSRSVSTAQYLVAFT